LLLDGWDCFFIGITSPSSDNGTFSSGVDDDGDDAGVVTDIDVDGVGRAPNNDIRATGAEATVRLVFPDAPPTPFLEVVDAITDF
jgi:hypothetical protein